VEFSTTDLTNYKQAYPTRFRTHRPVL